jgi:hypothetical protein
MCFDKVVVLGILPPYQHSNTNCATTVIRKGFESRNQREREGKGRDEPAGSEPGLQMTETPLPPHEPNLLCSRAQETLHLLMLFAIANYIPASV